MMVCRLASAGALWLWPQVLCFYFCNFLLSVRIKDIYMRTTDI